MDTWRVWRFAVTPVGFISVTINPFHVKSNLNVVGLTQLVGGWGVWRFYPCNRKHKACQRLRLLRIQGGPQTPYLPSNLANTRLDRSVRQFRRQRRLLEVNRGGLRNCCCCDYSFLAALAVSFKSTQVDFVIVVAVNTAFWQP